MTSLQKVYLVCGRTGEYSDTREWIVAGYEEKEQAEMHCALAQGEVKESENWEWERREEFKSSYDPGAQMDYTGISYYVVEVMTFVHLDQFLENIGQ